MLSGYVIAENFGSATRYSNFLSIPGGSVTTYGNAYFGAPPIHGSTNYSIVTLTASENNKSGSMIVSRPDLNYAFNNFDLDVVFSVKDGSDPGADGLRIGYGPISGAFGSEPGGAGLWFHIDTYDNLSVGTDTGIEIWYGGTRIYRRQLTTYNNLHGSQTGVSLDVTPSGLLSYSYSGDGTPSAASGQIQITGWNPQPDWRFGAAAQTGGSRDWHVIEDFYALERTEPPSIPVTGSSGTVMDNENPSFTWNSSDPNGDLASASAVVRYQGSTITSSSDFSGTISPSKDFGLGVYSVTTSVTDASYRSGSGSRSYILDDDDKAAPTISLDGSIGFESHALSNQRLSWSATDTSGIYSSNAVVLFNNSPIFTSSLASGEFDLESYASNPNYGPGEYELRVFATDNDNDRTSDRLTSSTFSRKVTITNAGPTANAGLNITGREGIAVAFDGSRSSDTDEEPLSYQWDFGDGQIGVGVAPNHVYQDNGTYHVMLMVRDALGLQSTHSLDVTVVNVAVTISDVSNSGPVNEGESVTVNVAANDVSGDTLTYEFDFDNDGVYETSNFTGVASHSYSTANVYPVNVRVVDGDGGVAISWTAVQVGSPTAIIPTITFDASDTDVGEAAGMIAITANLNQPTTAAVFVPLLVSGSAVAGDDFSLPFTYLLIPAGAVTGSANIAILDDASDEYLENLLITMGAPLNAAIGAIDSYTVRIDDNDEAPEVSFFEAARSIDESAGTIPLRAKVAVVSGKEIRIPLSVAGTADSPDDYLFPGGAEIVIPAGASVGAVDLVIVDDTTPESNQTIIVSMGPPTNAFASGTAARPSTQTITIPQNDAPSLSLSPAFRQVEENVGVLTITGTLSAAPALPVTATLAIDGTAQAADYADALLSLNFGMSQTATTTIRIVNDNLTEAAESLVVLLTGATNARLGATRASVFEIAPSDIPAVSFSTDAQERFEDGADIVVTATLSNASTETIYVPLHLSGTANDFDYGVPNGAYLEFAPGETSASLSIDLTDDTQSESSETIFVTLGASSNAVPGATTKQSITVFDDDPTVAFDEVTSVAENVPGGKYRLTARLSTATNQSVSVPYSIFGSATAGVDYTRPSGSIVIPAGQTSGFVDISITNDQLVEGTETLSVYMGVPTNANYGTRPAIDVRILDDERTGFQLARTEFEAPEFIGAESYSVVTVQYSLTAARDYLVSIPVRLSYDGNEEIVLNEDAENTALGVGRLDISPGTTSGTAKVIIQHDGEARDDATLKVDLGTPSDPSVDLEKSQFVIRTSAMNSAYPPPDDPSVQEYEGRDDGRPPTPMNLLFDAVGRGANAFRSWVRGLFSKGYIAGGVAFFDANKNGSLDFLDLNLDGIQDPNEPSEPSALTGLDGQYSLAIPSLFDRNANLTFDTHEGQFVLTGGVDTATGAPQVGSLIAPMGFLVGSPLSTLAANLVNEHGLTTEQALARVTSALGLPALDLRKFDTIAEAVGGNLDASLIFAAEAMLQDTAAQIASLVGAMADAPPPASVANLVFNDLAAKIAPSTAQLDLSNSFAVAATIGGVLDRTGLTMAPNVVSTAATAIVAANAHIESLPLVSGLAYLTEVVQTQVVAQGTAATALAGLANGADANELATLLADYTGQSLVNKIDAAPIGNITPLGISIGDASLVENDAGESILEFTVSLDAVPTTPVSVSFGTQNYTAQAGSDYLAVAGLLSWAAGDATTRTVQVRVFGDGLLESDETFRVQLSGATGAIVADGSGSGAILNDDQLQYQAPNEGVANELTLEIDSAEIALIRNGASIFEGPYSASDPIVVAGANGVNNSLAVAFAAMNPTDPDAGLNAPIIFNGGNGIDLLSIDNAAAQFALHYLQGPGAGRFEIDGIPLSYTDVEAVTNRIAPTLSLPSGALFEGPSEIVIIGAGADSQITYAYSWLVSKGQEIVASGNNTEVRFTAQDDGIYRVQFQTTAEGTGVGVTIVDLAVANVNPTFEVGGNETLMPPVAGVFARQGISFTDPGADIWTGTVDFGDGSESAPLEINQQSKSFDLSHTYAVSGAFTVTVTVKDEDGEAQTDAFQVTVILNTPPIAIDDSSATDEDHSVTINVLANDTDEQNNIVAAQTAIVSIPSVGALINNGNGTFAFDPRGAFDYLAVGEAAPANFVYRIIDAFGDSDTATATITVSGVNDRPTIAVGAAQIEVDEGRTASNSGSFSDLDLSDRPTITASFGAIVQDSSNSGAWSWSFAASDGRGESQTVTITADDGHGGVAQTSFVLKVKNVNPTVAITGAPVDSPEGTAVALGLSASDPAGANDALTFTWSVTKNGSPYAAGAGSSFSVAPDDNGSYVVNVVADDGDGGIGNDSKTIVVTNVAPAIDSFTGPSSGVRGQSLSFSSTDSDVGTADTHTRQWRVLNSQSAVVESGEGASFSFVPTQLGVYSVRFDVSDDDGSTDFAVQSLTVVAVQLQPDTTDSAKTALVVGGTTGNDDIVFSPSGNSGGVEVSINGISQGVFSPTGRIIAYGQAGNDDLQVAGSIARSAWLYGDAGNDRIKGGNGDDTLLGGEGDDLLVGGAGRDFMIGGLDADRMVGNADDDILIAGITAYDRHEQALNEILQEWRRTDVSYSARIAHLQALLNSTTVGNDNSADVLTGSSGMDWFLFDSPQDRATDLHDEAFLNDLDFINLDF